MTNNEKSTNESPATMTGALVMTSTGNVTLYLDYKGSTYLLGSHAGSTEWDVFNVETEVHFKISFEALGRILEDAKADAPVAEAAKADAPKLSKFRYTKAADHAPDDSIETNWCSYDVTAILTDGSEIEIGNVHSCTDRWRTGWGHVNTTFAESTRHEAAQDLWRRYMQKQADAAKAEVTPMS